MAFGAQEFAGAHFAGTTGETSSYHTRNAEYKSRQRFPPGALKETGAQLAVNIDAGLRNLRQVGFLTGRLAGSTEKQYWRSWKNWQFFCDSRDISHWRNTKGESWDETIIDFILHELGGNNMKPSSIRTKLAGVRLFHVDGWKSDFSVGASRYKLVLKKLARRVKISRTYPLTVEMLHFARENLNGRKGNTTHWVIWRAVLLGFPFLLRGSELADVRPNDARPNSDANGVYMTLFVKGSKADVKAQGVFRSLYATNSDFCAVRNLERFAKISRQQKVDENDSLFPNGIYHLRIAIKWAATAFALDEKMCPIHSTRSGGATALASNGAEIDVIRRFGRWLLGCLRIYISILMMAQCDI